MCIAVIPLACGSDDNGEEITVDAEAVYSVNAAKDVGDYSEGESLATVIDADGAITQASLGSSELPDGVALDAITGELTVSDVGALVAGTYEIDVTTEDVNSGTTMHTVTLVFNENPVVVNINSGGDALIFTDIEYMADQFFVGTSDSFTPDPPPADIVNTEMDDLYITERFGTDFGYAVELENGTYTITLHFVELFWGAPGSGSAGGEGDRVFDVSLEGLVVKDDYDIFAEVGALTATQEEFEVILTDGMLNIDFLASADNAKLTAIEIEKVN